MFEYFADTNMMKRFESVQWIFSINVGNPFDLFFVHSNIERYLYIYIDCIPTKRIVMGWLHKWNILLIFWHIYLKTAVKQQQKQDRQLVHLNSSASPSEFSTAKIWWKKSPQNDSSETGNANCFLFFSFCYVNDDLFFIKIHKTFKFIRIYNQ